MPAIKCKKCGRNYSNTLKNCPYCQTETLEDVTPTKKEIIQKQPIKHDAPIHTRSASKKVSEKAEDTNETYSDKNKFDDTLARLQARLDAMEAENEKLKQSLKEQEDKKESEVIKEVTTTTASNDSQTEINDTDTDENFDRIMNPEKYAKETSPKVNSIVDKVSGILPTLKEAAKKETSKYLSKPSNGSEEDNNEDFDPMHTSSIVCDEEVTDDEISSLPNAVDIEEYDPNYDHYYDDELPELLAEKERIPKAIIIRSCILIAACLVAFIVAAFRLVNNV